MLCWKDYKVEYHLCNDFVDGSTQLVYLCVPPSSCFASNSLTLMDIYSLESKLESSVTSSWTELKRADIHLKKTCSIKYFQPAPVSLCLSFHLTVTLSTPTFLIPRLFSVSPPIIRCDASIAKLAVAMSSGGSETY